MSPVPPCRRIEPRLTAWLLGELPPRRAEEVRQHLELCAACRAAADDLRRAVDIVSAVLAGSEEPAGLSPERREALSRPRLRAAGSVGGRRWAELAWAAGLALALGGVALLRHHVDTWPARQAAREGPAATEIAQVRDIETADIVERELGAVAPAERPQGAAGAAAHSRDAVAVRRGGFSGGPPAPAASVPPGRPAASGPGRANGKSAPVALSEAERRRQDGEDRARARAEVRRFAGAAPAAGAPGPAPAAIAAAEAVERAARRKAHTMDFEGRAGLSAGSLPPADVEGVIRERELNAYLMRPILMVETAEGARRSVLVEPDTEVVRGGVTLPPARDYPDLGIRTRVHVWLREGADRDKDAAPARARRIEILD